MKYAVAAALLFAAATPAFAQEGININVDGEDSIVRVIERVPIHKSTFHIVNRTKHTALVLRPSGTMVLQLTDAGLKHVQKEVRKEGDGVLGKVLHGALAGALNQVLDHGMEYELSDLKEARVEKGVLVFERKNGERIFDDMEINDEDVMASFSPGEALRFADRINQVLRARR